MRLPRLQDLSPWIATKLRAPKELTWQVELLDPRDPAHRGRIRWLSLRPDYRVTDTLAMQLDDLVATTHPGARLQGHALERALAEARGGRPLEECGTYVHYPWKKELVRVLDRDDFVRLRTNRNWYKITPEEQSALGRKTVAIAGLSVGEVRQYLAYCADQRLATLGMAKVYGAKNPFGFLALQDVQEVTNFFERRVSAYQVGVEGEVSLDAAF